MLPERGQCPGMPARSGAGRRRHGAAVRSARVHLPGHVILSAGRGHMPALVATANEVAVLARCAVATVIAAMRWPRQSPS